MGGTSERSMRIGEVAELTGTTPRTIRYYEEIGLLPGAVDREQGKHRCYDQRDVERLREIVRLRDLLGLSLEQLRTLIDAEAARAEIRREYRESEDPAVRRSLIEQALGHIATQLELVRRRRGELERLEAELEERRAVALEKLSELGRPGRMRPGPGPCMHGPAVARMRATGQPAQPAGEAHSGA